MKNLRNMVVTMITALMVVLCIPLSSNVVLAADAESATEQLGVGASSVTVKGKRIIEKHTFKNTSSECVFLDKISKKDREVKLPVKKQKQLSDTYLSGRHVETTIVVKTYTTEKYYKGMQYKDVVHDTYTTIKTVTYLPGYLPELVSAW